MLISGKDKMIGVIMNDFERIENKFLGNKEAFCEFLSSLYNKGMCKISVGFKDDLHFYFHRENNVFGINDLFIYSEDFDYIDSVLRSCDGLLTASIISSNGLDVKRYENEWKVSVRRQFYKNSMSSDDSSFDTYTQLDKSHSSVIEASSSETVRQNYAMAMDFDDECYAHIDGGLISFLSTCCNKKVNAIEINWIYTEPEYRNKGYAASLLSKVSDYYVSKGYMTTYHCSNNNIASANTALKAGFVETVNEIILERK